MIITRTPHRCSLYGGGTDYESFYRHAGAFLVGFTIDQYVYMYVRRCLDIFNYKSRISYSKIEDVQQNCEVEHPGVRGVLEHFGVKEGLSIGMCSDLPARTGLGSSSSMVVGLSRAMEEYLDLVHSKKRLAQTAIEIERVLLQEPGGIQDQIWAAYGGVNSIEIMPNGDFAVKPLPVSKEFLEEFRSRIVLCHTGFSRDSFDIAASHDNQSSYDVKKRILDIAHDGYDAFCIQDIEKIGAKLHQSWKHKREVSKKISTESIDVLYTKALYSGAIGGKLLGAGGSGFLFFVLREGIDKKEFCATMGLTGIEFNYSFEGSEILLK